MKKFKTLRRRGLALFVALVMCLGMLPTTAFAAEDSDHTCNADGWVCEETAADVLICKIEEHVHTDACYASETVYACSPEDEEHEHTDECPTITKSDLVCAIEEHTHSYDECYATEVEETHVAPSEDVTRFLEAVKEISEQVTADDESAIAAAREAYEALSDADKSNYAVVEALEILEAAEEALDAIDSNPVEDAGDESEAPSDVDVPEDGDEPEEGGEIAAEPVGGEESNEDEEPAELSDAVKDFLAAVEALPDKITEENRAAVEEQLTAIDELRTKLSDEDLNREDVIAALEKLEKVQKLVTNNEPTSWDPTSEIPTPWLQGRLDTEKLVVLDSDIEIMKNEDGTWTPNKGALVISKDVTLDLYGHKLTWRTPTNRNGYSDSSNKTYPLDDERNLFTIENGATLTIKDSKNPGGGNEANVPLASIEAADGSDPNNIFCILDGGKLVIESGVYNGSGGRGAWVVGGGTMKMTGGTIVECKATSEFGGGAVYVSGTFDMSGGMISWSKAEDTAVGEKAGDEVDASYKKGGGVYVDGSGTFNMSGGTIRNCDAKDPDRGQGGGVYVAQNGTFDMSGGAVTNNGAAEGSGVYSAGTFSMSKGDITNHDHTSKNNDVKVFHCTAGGGVYIAGGTFNKTGGGITANNAALGGGIYIADGTVTIKTDGTVIGNDAENGGGVYVADGEVTIGRSGFHNNHAYQNGGGLYVAGGDVEINNTSDSIWGNKAGQKGGGIYIDTNATVTMSAAMSVHQNQAKLGGGVYNAGTFNVTSQEAKIYKNYAFTAGDDIYSDTALTLPTPNNGQLDNGDPVDSLVAPNVNGMIWQFWCPDYGQTNKDGNPKCPSHHVTGWFDDSEGDRWDAHDNRGDDGFHAVTYDPDTASGPVALKAAHPPCTYVVEYYTSDDAENYTEVFDVAEIGPDAPTAPGAHGWTREGEVMFGIKDAPIQPLSELNPGLTLEFPARIVDDQYLCVKMTINDNPAENPYELRYNDETKGVTTIKVYYLKDVEGDPNEPDGDGKDGIPDAYQVKVTFLSENGRMGPTKAKINGGKGEVVARDLFTKQQQFTKLVVYVTLFGEDGEMSAKGKTNSLGNSAKLCELYRLYEPETDATAWANAQAAAKDSGAVIPTVGNHPDAYHTKPGHWATDPAGRVITAGMTDAERTFTYIYNPTTAKITVNYIDEDDPNGAHLKDSYISPEYGLKDSYDVTSQVEGSDSKIEGYVQTRYEIVGANGKRVGLKIDNVIDVVNFTVNVYYSKDVIGVPNGGDDIPDKYQVPVNYKVVNGTWVSEDGYTVSEDHVLTTYVTLYKDGTEANGYALPTDAGAKGYLTAEQIPSAAANTGYDQESEKWTDEKPATTTGITGEVTYTVTYSPRNDLSYTVKYLEKDTDKELAETKVVNGQTFDSEVTEKAIDQLIQAQRILPSMKYERRSNCMFRVFP